MPPLVAALILLPALAGATALFARSRALRNGLLLGGAISHAILTALAWRARAPVAPDAWFGFDPLGLLFLGAVSALFLASALHALGHFRHRNGEGEEGSDDAPETLLVGCLLLFLSAMTLVTASQHLGLVWIAIEATTLASAPLIYYHRHHRSLEATWKYLMVCSVGIALALLGNFFLGVAASTPGDRSQVLLLGALTRDAARLQIPWLNAAFILTVVGYGTKMGLAPLHTWLPDAHSEAPAPVSALLSGALLNCAFLGILRVRQVCVAAGQAALGADVLIALGILSMAVGAIFIFGQTDYKRLLAYSSVEHMGVLAIGAGLGGLGAAGSLLHALNHSLVKAMLFLVAGNILALYRTKTIAHVRGLKRIDPASGALWLAGFLAITGLPPFGLFPSKLLILKAAFDTHHAWVAVASLALFAVVFMGMAETFLGMTQSPPPDRPPAGERPGPWQILPPALLAIAALVLGCHIPAPLRALIDAAAKTMGGAW